jgi:hypothetical protein
MVTGNVPTDQRLRPKRCVNRDRRTASDQALRAAWPVTLGEGSRRGSCDLETYADAASADHRNEGAE